jgi:hypothetical protein
MPPVVQSAPERGSNIWLLLGILIGLPLLLARLADHSQPQSSQVEVRRALPTTSPTVEVRRALPVVLRALPVTSAENPPTPVPYAQSRLVTMPDGSIVDARYQGELSSSAALPPQGRFIGEAWSTGNTTWIWMQPAHGVASWVDP